MPRIYKEGWLEKMGSNRIWSSWKIRYIVLRKDRLEYYEDRFKQKKKGSIALDGLENVQEIDVGSPHRFGFQLVTAERTWIFASDSSDRQEQWCKAIRAVLNRLDSRDTTIGDSGRISLKRRYTPHETENKQEEPPKFYNLAQFSQAVRSRGFDNRFETDLKIRDAFNKLDYKQKGWVPANRVNDFFSVVAEMKWRTTVAEKKSPRNHLPDWQYPNMPELSPKAFQTLLQSASNGRISPVKSKQRFDWSMVAHIPRTAVPTMRRSTSHEMSRNRRNEDTRDLHISVQPVQTNGSKQGKVNDQIPHRRESRTKKTKNGTRLGDRRGRPSDDPQQFSPRTWISKLRQKNPRAVNLTVASPTSDETPKRSRPASPMSPELDLSDEDVEFDTVDVDAWHVDSTSGRPRGKSRSAPISPRKRRSRRSREASDEILDEQNDRMDKPKKRHRKRSSDSSNALQAALNKGVSRSDGKSNSRPNSRPSSTRQSKRKKERITPTTSPELSPINSPFLTPTASPRNFKLNDGALSSSPSVSPNASPSSSPRLRVTDKRRHDDGRRGASPSPFVFQKANTQAVGISTQAERLDVPNGIILSKDMEDGRFQLQIERDKLQKEQAVLLQLKQDIDRASNELSKEKQRLDSEWIALRAQQNQSRRGKKTNTNGANHRRGDSLSYSDDLKSNGFDDDISQPFGSTAPEFNSSYKTEFSFSYDSNFNSKTRAGNFQEFDVEDSVWDILEDDDRPVWMVPRHRSQSEGDIDAPLGRLWVEHERDMLARERSELDAMRVQLGNRMKAKKEKFRLRKKALQSKEFNIDLKTQKVHELKSNLRNELADFQGQWNSLVAQQQDVIVDALSKTIASIEEALHDRTTLTAQDLREQLTRLCEGREKIKEASIEIDIFDVDDMVDLD